jgi:hypothetical protein
VKCVFCRYFIEDRGHLFFACSYSGRIWKSLMNLCDVAAPPLSWEGVVIEGLKNWRNKVFRAFVCRLAFGSPVYHLWWNRNAIKHANHPLSEDKLLQKIKWDTRACIMDIGKFRNTKGNIHICSNGGINPPNSDIGWLIFVLFYNVPES